MEALILGTLVVFVLFAHYCALAQRQWLRCMIWGFVPPVGQIILLGCMFDTIRGRKPKGKS